MKTKANIRYLGFRSTNEGGRYFDFCVSGPGVAEFLTSCEIPAHFLHGAGRVPLQQGVGICYEKLKRLLETRLLTELPTQMCLTASDLESHRQVVPDSFTSMPGFGASSGKIS